MNLKRYDNLRTHYMFLFGYSILLIIMSLFFNNPIEIFNGMIKILFTTDNLITDYMELASIGAALFNAGTVALFYSYIVKRCHSNVSGPVIAAIFVVSGFALFGKNIFNSLPYAIGTYIYAKVEHLRYNRLVLVSIFASALGPLVSELAFGLNLPIWQGVILSYTIGIFVGFVLPTLSSRFLTFHQGYNIYNAGFTAGIVGMFFVAILRMFGFEVASSSIVYSGSNVQFYLIFIVIFTVLIILGYMFNGKSFRNYSLILKNTGRLVADFSSQYGFGVTLVNMGIMGYISLFYVYLVGGTLNGPVLGGVITVVGFGAFGKHPKNTIPIFIGVYLALVLNIYPKNSTSGILAALFGTTLAPISGQFGALAGIIAGFAHMGLVTNVGYVHGGVNLYNNGYSGGFVAATLVPVFEHFKDIFNRRKNWKEKHTKLGR